MTPVTSSLRDTPSPVSCTAVIIWRGHCLVVTPVTSSLRDTHPPVFCIAVIVRRGHRLVVTPVTSSLTDTPPPVFSTAVIICRGHRLVVIPVTSSLTNTPPPGFSTAVIIWRGHRLVVTPVTSLLRDTPAPISCSAAIIWRRGEYRCTDGRGSITTACNVVTQVHSSSVHLPEVKCLHCWSSLLTSAVTTFWYSRQTGLQQSVAPAPPPAVSVHPASQRQSHLALLFLHLLVATV